MSQRDVINDLLYKRKAERVGLFDSPWPETMQAWVRDNNLTESDPTDLFGFDMCMVGGWFDYMPLKGVLEVVDQTDEWQILRTGAGSTIKVWKHKSGTPEHISYEMKSREIWEKSYREHLLGVDKGRLEIDSTKSLLESRKKQGLWTFYGHLSIWETMRQTMGEVCMFENLLLDQDWIHDYNRVYTDFYLAHFQALIEEAGKPDGIWLFDDLGYKNGLFCSPRLLEKLFLPYYKEIVSFFHRLDLPVVLHSCGNITDALPIIVEAGFDALNPMEVKAGCDLLKFGEQYGDRLAFVGGLDARILESGDKERIKNEVIRIVEGMKARGARYVFGSDHSLSPLVKYEDFKYAIDVYKEHMLY